MWNPPKEGSKGRAAMPKDAFFDQKNKEYPYKEKINGQWTPTKAGVHAAIVRSSINHDANIKQKAQAMYKKMK